MGESELVFKGSVGEVKVRLDENGMKDALLFKAREIAQALGKERNLNSTKLRQYYQSISRILEGLKHKTSESKACWTEFYLLKAKASYDSTRGVIPASFRNLISSIVDYCADDINALERAKLFLEAVVGFFPKK